MGLFLIFGTCLLTSHWSSYLVAILVIGTTVTQTEFLQNIAAIIRGGNGYWDYKLKSNKEFLSQDEVGRSIEKEMEELDKLNDSPTEEQRTEGSESTRPSTPNNSNTDSGQALFSSVPAKTQTRTVIGLPNRLFGVLVEDYAFKFLERMQNIAIQRHVRFYNDNFSIEFDGLIEGPVEHTLFEVKASRRSSFPPSFLVEAASRQLEWAKKYVEITNKPALFRLVVIGDFSPEFIKKNTNILYISTPSHPNVRKSFEFYSFSEIGLSPDELNSTV